MVLLTLFLLLLLIAFSYFFCKLPVFYYKDILIATVKAFPNGREKKDEKINV